MMIDSLLRKLAPLLPDKVRRWRRALDLTDPDLRVLLEKEILATAHKRLGNFRERLLLSLPPREKAKGALHLGLILYDEEKWPAGLQLPELMQNVAIFGRSGAGKTNVVFHLLEQLVTKRIPFIFLDWKRTGRHLLPRLGKRTRLYTPGRKLAPFPFNPFIPPPGLEYAVYTNHVVDVLGDAYTLGDAARSLLHKAIRACEGLKAPTVEDVKRRLNEIPDKERVRGWKSSALRALDSVAAIDLANNDVTQAAMVQALLKYSAIIELDALAPSNKKFLLPLLCLWVYYLKLPTSKREQLSLVIVVEEAHHLLYRRDAGRESLMEQLLRQCREIGIGIIVVDQHPHLISSAALGNTYTSICLNLKDPTDINKAAAISLVEDKQAFSRLPVGHGVVKLQDRWHEPFLVRFPLVSVQKGVVTDEAIAALSRGKTTLSGLAGREPGENAAEGRSRNGDTPLDEAELRFLHDIIKHPETGVDARYKRLGMSIDKGNRIKRTLISKEIIEETQLKTGRTRKVAVRITTTAQTRFGLEPRAAEPGSIEHEYWKRWYAEKLEQAGYRVLLEAPRNRGHVDVLGTRGAESVAIEVETGKSDPLWNVQQDLLSGFRTVVVVATNERAKEKIEEQLARAGLLMDRVRVVLRDANDALP